MEGYSPPINPSQQIIYINKQRPPIFTEEYNLKHKKKTFDDIYNSPIFNELSFLISNDQQPCECLDTIHQCPKMKDILKDSKKQQAKAIFQKLKLQAIQAVSNNQRDQTRFSIENEVLLPHFDSLLSVVNTQNPSILVELLKHIKTDYATFWIYGLYCSKFSPFQTMIQNMSQISIKMNLDIDLQALIQGDSNDSLRTAYETKLLSIFKASFPSVVSIVCKSHQNSMMIEKLLICHFIRGRQRKDIEVIKAAMVM